MRILAIVIGATKGCVRSRSIKWRLGVKMKEGYLFACPVQGGHLAPIKGLKAKNLVTQQTILTTFVNAFFLLGIPKVILSRLNLS